MDKQEKEVNFSGREKHAKTWWLFFALFGRFLFGVFVMSIGVAFVLSLVYGLVLNKKLPTSEFFLSFATFITTWSAAYFALKRITVKYFTARKTAVQLMFFALILAMLWFLWFSCLTKGMTIQLLLFQISGSVAATAFTFYRMRRFISKHETELALMASQPPAVLREKESQAEAPKSFYEWVAAKINSFERFAAAFFILFGFSWAVNLLWLREAITFLLAYILWRSWGKPKGVFFAGIIVAFSHFLAMAFILIAPLIEVAPYLAVTALLYSFFRGFFKIPKISNKYVRIGGALALVAIGIAITASPLYFIVNSGHKDILHPEHPYIGKELSFQTPLAYDSDCIKCGNTGISKEINRDLECVDDMTSVGKSAYKNRLKRIEYIPMNTIFTVKQVYTVEPYGFHIDASSYDMAVLEDPQGKQSTTLLSNVEDFLKKDYSGFCMNKPESISVALFTYLEEKKMARVFIQLVDYGYTREKAAVPYEVLLKKFKEEDFHGYHITNIQPFDELNSKRRGVIADVDADAAAFLMSMAIDDAYFRYPIDAEVFSLMPADELEYFQKNLLRIKEI